MNKIQMANREWADWKEGLAKEKVLREAELEAEFFKKLHKRKNKMNIKSDEVRSDENHEKIIENHVCHILRMLLESFRKHKS